MSSEQRDADGGTPDRDTANTADTATAFEEGGDPACWLNRLCPQCDAVPDDPEAATCWRCGATLHPAEGRMR